jgi:microcystin-dependent protein
MGEWFVGEIRNFSFGSVQGSPAPAGWLPCDGRSLAVNQYTALYSLLGNAFGGTATTFNLPDLRGRVAVGQGVNAQGKVYTRGKAGGAEAVTLAAEQLPPHSHAFAARAEAGTLPQASGNIVSSSGTNPPSVPSPQELYAAPGAPVPLNPGSLSMAGGAAGHPNMQPFTVTNFCIATSGIYPSRP